MDNNSENTNINRSKTLSNIVFIGMPSSGKSTIGSALAKKLDMNFIDTDHLIRESQQMELKDIVNNFGYKHFLKVQEDEILKLKIDNSVISTGGSVVYGEKSMLHLQGIGIVIYLAIGIDELSNRIDFNRRFAKSSEQSFKELYYERVPLYEKYANYSINCSNKNVNEIVNEITVKII